MFILARVETDKKCIYKGEQLNLKMEK